MQQRLRRAVNVVQQLREARPEEPEPLLAPFLASTDSRCSLLGLRDKLDDKKSKTWWTQTPPETPGYSSRARPWNKFKKKNVEANTKKSHENDDRIGYTFSQRMSGDVQSLATEEKSGGNMPWGRTWWNQHVLDDETRKSNSLEPLEIPRPRRAPL